MSFCLEGAAVGTMCLCSWEGCSCDCVTPPEFQAQEHWPFKKPHKANTRAKLSKCCASVPQISAQPLSIHHRDVSKVTLISTPQAFANQSVAGISRESQIGPAFCSGAACMEVSRKPGLHWENTVGSTLWAGLQQINSLALRPEPPSGFTLGSTSSSWSSAQVCGTHIEMHHP